jgi:hypothetical protein
MRNGQVFFFFYFKNSLWFNIYLNINRIVTKNSFVFNHWRIPLANNDTAFGSFHGKESEKEKILRIFLVLGICLSAYYATCLVLFNVNPEIRSYHIQYHTGFPKSLALVRNCFNLVHFDFSDYPEP